MKAFQLKIVIKNSKPPIWRRVIIPAGITFSQLSMILNKAMGWWGYHSFEFEFYHLELKIMEHADECEGFGSWDTLEAAGTFIREYLENNEWFTYTYDLGDDWQHRVTVEKIIDNWEYNYPKVLKYKGNCPIEDSGGIYGYYECLDIIHDDQNPEQQERLAWMESQGYPQDYDMEEVNQELQDEFFYIWGKGDARSQDELYEARLNGETGLKAAKRDKNKNLQINRSGRHRAEDSLQQIADLMKQYIGYPNPQLPALNDTKTLKDIFQDYTKEDLLDIARIKGIPRISRCSKSSLIDKIYDYMMRQEEVKRYFYYLTEAERKEFEQALLCEGFYQSPRPDLLDKIYKSAYVGMLGDERIFVTEDVRQAYYSIKSREFEEESRKRSFVWCCLQTIAKLYGIMPFEIFMKLVNVDSRMKMTEAEVRKIMLEVPEEYMDYVIHGNMIYHSELYPDDRGLLKEQGEKEYYIPTREEILDLAMEGYLLREQSLKQFQRYLKNKLGAMEKEAEFAGCMIWQLICGDAAQQKIFEVLDTMGLMVDSGRELDALIQQISILHNNTRMIVNRGFTLNELAQKRAKKENGGNSRAGGTALHGNQKIISFEQARREKIYPNDPCPCGSGKKYKNCCKNKK